MDVRSKSHKYFVCKIVDVFRGEIYEWILVLLYGSPYLHNRHLIEENMKEEIARKMINFKFVGILIKLKILIKYWGVGNHIQGKKKFYSMENGV